MVEEEPARVQAGDVRRAHEIRDEARILLQQVLEEALAPLHYAVRDLERRLEAIEQQSPAPPPAPPPVAPAPVAVRAIPPPAAVAPAVARQTANVSFGAVVATSYVPIPPAPRAPSIDLEVPFDGARRQRRVVVLFILLILILFGSLIGAAVASRIRGAG